MSIALEKLVQLNHTFILSIYHQNASQSLETQHLIILLFPFTMALRDYYIFNESHFDNYLNTSIIT